MNEGESEDEMPMVMWNGGRDETMSQKTKNRRSSFHRGLSVSRHFLLRWVTGNAIEWNGQCNQSSETDLLAARPLFGQMSRLCLSGALRRVDFPAQIGWKLGNMELWSVFFTEQSFSVANIIPLCCEIPSARFLFQDGVDGGRAGFWTLKTRDVE